MIAALWLGGCILLAWTIEAMSGFGSIVIALSLGALLLPLEAILPVLVALNVATSSWLAWQHRRHIDTALLGRRILPAMLLGTLAGVALRDVLPGPALKIGFALLILWFALRELRHGGARPPHGAAYTHGLIGAAGVTHGLIGAAGVTHGLFASGGPLLVYALAGSGVDKARFRATLITVWLLLNGVLLGAFLLQGRLAAHAAAIAAYLPVVAVAVVLGNRLHRGLDEARFRVMVLRLLAVVGAVLLVSQLRLLLH